MIEKNPTFYLDGYARSGNNFLKCLMKSAWPESFDNNYSEPNHDILKIKESILSYDATIIPIRKPYDSIVSHLNVLYKKVDNDSWEHYHSKNIYKTNEMPNVISVHAQERINASRLFFNAYLNIKNSVTIFDLKFMSENVDRIPGIIYKRHSLSKRPRVIKNDDIINLANIYLPKEVPFLPIEHANKDEIKSFLDSNNNVIERIKVCDDIYLDLLEYLDKDYYGI